MCDSAPGWSGLGLGLVLPGVGVAVWGLVGFWFRRGHVVDQGHHGCGGGAGHGGSDGALAPGVVVVLLAPLCCLCSFLWWPPYPGPLGSALRNVGVTNMVVHRTFVLTRCAHLYVICVGAESRRQI